MFSFSALVHLLCCILTAKTPTWNSREHLMELCGAMAGLDGHMDLILGAIRQYIVSASF